MSPMFAERRTLSLSPFDCFTFFALPCPLSLVFFNSDPCFSSILRTETMSSSFARSRCSSISRLAVSSRHVGVVARGTGELTGRSRELRALQIGLNGGDSVLQLDLRFSVRGSLQKSIHDANFESSRRIYRKLYFVRLL